ncbi:MAG: hypothetical protein FWE72_09365 [Spirochaetaceae bacterium]|nr:hypothetical protein [Spirochaetaceae bacterium]
MNEIVRAYEKSGLKSVGISLEAYAEGKAFLAKVNKEEKKNRAFGNDDNYVPRYDYREKLKMGWGNRG